MFAKLLGFLLFVGWQALSNRIGERAGEKKRRRERRREGERERGGGEGT